MSDLGYEEKVKEVSVADGYVYIDLLCGLRLSAPIVALPEAATAPTPAPAPAGDAVEPQRIVTPLH
jgi:hypothetical protein